MVSIRNAHLLENNHEAFSHDLWLKELFPNSSQNIQFLSKAWDFVSAYKKEPRFIIYIRNSIEMVEIISSLTMDKETYCAAFLFPFVQANLITEKQINENFGLSVAELIKGAIALYAVKNLKAAQNESVSAEQKQKVRKMLIALIEDFRSIVIKLAERITVLRGLGDEDKEERMVAVKECSNIYAPLANRLGIGQLKWELEDFCFRYQYPEEYRKIANLLDEKRIDRARYVEKLVQILSDKLKTEGISAEIYGRPKHIYSIWLKLKKKNLPFDQVYDVRAIRIIVDKLQDCYSVLGIIHQTYSHLPDEFDDYISNPKSNGYQSIHTVILGPENKTTEIQIRTRHMHEYAERGVAAHWGYKENNKIKKNVLNEKDFWLNSLSEKSDESILSEKLIDDLNEDPLVRVREKDAKGRIYVSTPSGDIVDLPEGATGLDFAYYLHSDIGNKCSVIKVWGKIVPFNYVLENGDRIEILTQKDHQPSKDWLNPDNGFLTTSRARSKVKAWFKKQNREENIQSGKQILDDLIKSRSLFLKEIEKDLFKRFSVNSLDEFYLNIAHNIFGVNQIGSYLDLLKEKSENTLKDFDAITLQQNQKKIDKKNNVYNIEIEGVDQVMYYLAGCCRPILHDKIEGFITQGRGIAIHRSDCEQFLELKACLPERIVAANWLNNKNAKYLVAIRVDGNDRPRFVSDLSSVLSEQKAILVSIRTNLNKKQNLISVEMQIQITNQEMIKKVISGFKRIKDTINVTRI